MTTVPLEVPAPPGFDFRSTVTSHGWVTLAPFAWDEEAGTVERVQALPDGRTVRLRIREGEGRTLEVEVEAPGRGPTEEGKGEAAGEGGGADGPDPAPAGDEVVTDVRRIFNLDLDLQPFYELLRGEKRYAWVEETGAGRLLRAPTVWEDLAKTLLTTNTTWAGTTGMVRRLTELGAPAGDGGHAFPAPGRVAALDPGELDARVKAGYRSAYLRELAAGIAEGRLDVESWAEAGRPAGELYDRVASLKGFGPYAAGTVCKLLGAFDRLALDSAARGAYAREFNGGRPASDAEIRDHYEPYGEWKGLVIWMDVLRAYRETAEQGPDGPGDA